MEIIQYKFENLNKALNTLKVAMSLLSEYQDNEQCCRQDLILALRDSLIQRFEYCVDLFWKFIKVYLEQKEKIELTSTSPRGVIRNAALIKLISEAESKKLLEMIDSRNQSSHIYRQEIADVIACNVPEYYKLMQNILERLKV